MLVILWTAQSFDSFLTNMKKERRKKDPNTLNAFPSQSSLGVVAFIHSINDMFAKRYIFITSLSFENFTRR